MRRYALILVLSFIICSQLVLLVHADARLPGVAPGQYLHYSANMTASGNDTELMANIQQSQGWENVTVLDVSGVNVTFQMVFYNATNNEESTEIFNVETGLVNGSGGGLMLFIAANLSAGNPVYIGGSGAPLINETVTATYLGQQLETNHVNVSSNQTNVNQYGYVTNFTMTGQLYWERKTGIMLDYHVEGDIYRPDGVGGVLITHVYLRMLILSAVPPPPAIPEFASFLILPIFIATTAFAIIAHKKKLHWSFRE